MVRTRIQKIEPNYFKNGMFSGTFFFNLPALPGSYEAHTVVTDHNAKPIGMLRWSWIQTAALSYDPVILRIIRHEAPFPSQRGKLHSGWLKLHNQKI